MVMIVMMIVMMVVMMMMAVMMMMIVMMVVMMMMMIEMIDSLVATFKPHTSATTSPLNSNTLMILRSVVNVDDDPPAAKHTYTHC